ncbi:MAG: helix-turn-helix transcriptional regulator [Clostridia bacterium]|nr:helix-turn-helix transcriptional regulator [Clostridia bacterium]
MIGDKIKKLRKSQNFTQSAVARKLGITRSSVNTWEMGISVPSTQYIVELAMLFNVSSDYLLDISRNASINVTGLSEKEVAVVKEIVDCLKKSKI